MNRLERKVDRIYAKLLMNDSSQAQQSNLSIISTTSTLSLLETNEDETGNY